MTKQSGNNKKKNARGSDNISLLLAVNKAAELLLTANDTESIDDVLISSLEIIGRAISIDRVHIWYNEQESGKTSIKLIYTWVSEVGKHHLPVPNSLPSPFNQFPQWLDIFRLGKYVGGPVSSLSEEEQEFFNTFNIKTIFMIPLIFGDVFWGLVSIDDCENERHFSEEEIGIIKSFSFMVASAINHRRLVLDLIATNELANAATRAKNAFLSNMSHEVRTPLNAIVGMAMVGRESQSVAEKDHALNKIGDASAHLLTIISNVLDMARIEEGKLELSPVEYNFRDIIEKAVSPARILAGEKNQSFSISIDKAIPRHVVGDDVRLGQIIENLISNAVKFTPVYGKVSLDASVSGEYDNSFELQIVVKDNGIGMAENQRGKIFTAFEQVHGALNRDYGGTGLGLPISKHIIDLMGGKIMVTSEPNRGTTVVLTVRLEKGRCDAYPVEEETADSSESESAAIKPGEFKGKRLLIVEDIEINREILIALLKNSEIIIECAEDGQVALNMVMFNIEKYDIIFMDLQMPNMGGLESTRRIRGLPGRKRGRLPIIAMTANVLADDIKACIAAGMDDHLSKPLDIDKVLDMLRKYLSVPDPGQEEQGI